MVKEKLFNFAYKFKNLENRIIREIAQKKCTKLVNMYGKHKKYAFKVMLQ